MDHETEIKTRFAPSPTGIVHLGNIRTALFSFLFACRHHGAFILRIEDTDVARLDIQAQTVLQEDLSWLQFVWQSGVASDRGGIQQVPCLQSERTSIYQQYLDKLLVCAQAYPCFCTQERLSALKQQQCREKRAPRYDGHCRDLSQAQITALRETGIKPVVRFRMSTDEIIFEDLVRGNQCFNAGHIGDYVIQRANGSFTFLFCNAIDDAIMGITHVIRGEDHLSNTPKQIDLLKKLELTVPTYAHVPLVLGKEHKPLSKRQGDLTIQGLRQQGYLSTAVLNYCARLGHTMDRDHLYTSMDTLSQQFHIENVSESSACFDHKQLDNWQKRVVMSMTDAAFWSWIMPTGIADIIPEDCRQLFIDIFKKNVMFPNEAWDHANRIYGASLAYTAAQSEIMLEAGAGFFEQVMVCAKQQAEPPFDGWLDAVGQATGCAGRKLFQPIRIALTGQEHGIPLTEVRLLMLRDIFEQRLRQAAQMCHHAP